MGIFSKCDTVLPISNNTKYFLPYLEIQFPLLAAHIEMATSRYKSQKNINAIILNKIHESRFGHLLVL